MLGSEVKSCAGCGHWRCIGQNGHEFACHFILDQQVSRPDKSNRPGERCANFDPSKYAQTPWDDLRLEGSIKTRDRKVFRKMFQEA